MTESLEDIVRDTDMEGSQPSGPVTGVLIGAGQRGMFVYGKYAEEHPDELDFIAVVEPRDSRRKEFARRHNIPAEHQYKHWDDFLNASEPIAEACFITTGDRLHHEPSIKAMKAGYDVLLEKPIAESLRKSYEVVKTAEDTGRLLSIGHVLRYTPFFRTVHDILKSGEIGEIITVEHRENVSFSHMAHSFVRGNSSRSDLGTPMIVAKSCHDFDILHWNIDEPFTRLSSIGSLKHFRPENAPDGATERCTDGCPAAEKCNYYAPRQYVDTKNTGWPVHVITEDFSREGRLEALKTGPWGKCVYKAGSNVVDHQIVTMETESGASVVMAMHGHSTKEGRTMRYDGTKGTLRASTIGRKIEVGYHLTREVKEIEVPKAIGGHGGGDPGIIGDFVKAVRGEGEVLTSGRESLESHVLAYAAEEARLTGTWIDLANYRRKVFREDDLKGN